MKLLILKTDAILNKDIERDLKSSLANGIRDGVILLDGAVNYEVVEFDSLTLDGETITNEAELLRKDKECYLARKYRMMNNLRKARKNREE